MRHAKTTRISISKSRTVPNAIIFGNPHRPRKKNGPHRTVKAACMFSQPEGYSTGISLLTFFEPTRA